MAKKQKKKARATKEQAHKLRAVAEMKKARTAFTRKIGQIMKDYDLFMQSTYDCSASDILKNCNRGIKDVAYIMLENTVSSMWSTQLQDKMFARFSLRTRSELVQERESLKDHQF